MRRDLNNFAGVAQQIIGIAILRTDQDVEGIRSVDDAGIDQEQRQLAAIDDGLHRMEVTIAAGGNALEENPAALTSVLISITSALGTAGATASQLKAIRSRTDALGKLLGP